MTRAAEPASCLRRHAHDPTPFRRISRCRLAALGLPESPSPHPSGCDPDEACACSLRAPFLRRRRGGARPRTWVTRLRCPSPRHARLGAAAFESVRAFRRCFEHPRASRTRCVRPTSALRNIQLEHPELRRFPALRPRFEATSRPLRAPFALVPSLAARARPREIVSSLALSPRSS